MSEVAGDQTRIARLKQSWMIAAVFVGMGTGFIVFWLTLVMLNAVIFSAFISLVAWPITREKGGSDFATKTTILFFVATIVGILVGLGSSIGSGLPVGGL